MKSLVGAVLAATITSTLLAAGSVRGECMSFECGFTDWNGTDASATSPITSPTGHTPGSDWTITFDGASYTGLEGWLIQGDIDGTPTTAMFAHSSPVISARARFSAAFPLEWVNHGLQATSLTVDFRLRCLSGYNAGGGPIQISYPTIYGMFNAYIRVRNQGGEIRPLDSGTNNIPGVNALNIPLGSDWHTWRIIVVYGEYADYGNGPKHWAYWDVYLDGTGEENKLLFTGEHGSPEFNGHTYSFRTSVDNVSSREPQYILRGDGRIGLGEMRNAQQWGFEFDYVNFSVADFSAPDLPSELYRWSFDTTDDAEQWNLYNEIYYSAGPAPADDIAQQDTYTFPGDPPAGQAQTVFVNLMGRDPLQWPWGGVNPTSGGALYSQRAGGWGMWLVDGVKSELDLPGDVMAIEFNLSNTTNRFDTKDLDVWIDFFLREPGPPHNVARLRSKRLSAEGSNQSNPWKWSRTRFHLAEFPDMELIAGSRWWQSPGTYSLDNLNDLFAVNFVAHPDTVTTTTVFIDDIRLYGSACGLVIPHGTQSITVARGELVDPIIYVYSHTGPGEVSYMVEETDAQGVPYDYPWLALNKTGGGPLSGGQSDEVIVTVTDTQMIPGTHTAYITFVDTCDPVLTHMRRIDLTISSIFGDWDQDGDIDMDDFAAFQRCWTGMGDPHGEFVPECAVFDRPPGDQAVDGADLAYFLGCATGPGVLWVSTPACP